jgi:hypothetical protein
MSIFLKFIITIIVILVGYIIQLYVKGSTISIVIMFFLFINYYYNYLNHSNNIYLILAVIFYSILIYLIYSTDYFNVTAAQNPWYIILLILSVFLVIGTALFRKYSYIGLFIFILLGFVIFVNYFLKYILEFFIYLSDPDSSKSYFKYIFISIAVVIGLGIVYYLYKNTSSNVVNILNIYWNYIDNFIRTIWIRTKIAYDNVDGYDIFIFLISLVVMILLLFYKPLYHYFIYLNKGKYLIQHPITLSEETTLDYKPEFQYQYSISLWVWFNEHQSMYHIVPILDYGGSPLIEYNIEKNKLDVIFINQNKLKEKIVSSKVQLQKWNHIVINNIGGTVDVFINGTLIKTVNNVIPFNSVKNITVGSSKGIRGGLTNLMYFSQPLTIHQINQIYSYTPKY